MKVEPTSYSVAVRPTGMAKTSLWLKTRRYYLEKQAR